MPREFDRNMFIMLLAIMIGVIIITYFTADIIRRTEIENLQSKIKTRDVEIQDVKERNINFTSYFLKSSAVLDKAREDRADGNYNFDVGFLWYTTALSEKNSSKLGIYKNRTIKKCEHAMYNYTNSYHNFKKASEFYLKTKNYTVYDEYLMLLDLYVNLTKSGARLSNLRYNASLYLMYLTENLTIENDTVTFIGNMSDIEQYFNETMFLYGLEEDNYEQYLEQIKEYDIEGFSEFRD